MPQSRFDAEDEGVDLIIDCTGVPMALESALPYTKNGATVLVFGCAPVGKPMKICPEEIFSKELTILGTKINPYTFAEAVSLVANMGDRYIDLKKLGIGVYSLDRYHEGLEKLRRGEISKLMFELEEWIYNNLKDDHIPEFCFSVENNFDYFQLHKTPDLLWSFLQ